MLNENQKINSIILSKNLRTTSKQFKLYRFFIVWDLQTNKRYSTTCTAHFGNYCKECKVTGKYRRILFIQNLFTTIVLLQNLGKGLDVHAPHQGLFSRMNSLPIYDVMAFALSPPPQPQLFCLLNGLFLKNNLTYFVGIVHDAVEYLIKVPKITHRTFYQLKSYTTLKLIYMKN